MSLAQEQAYVTGIFQNILFRSASDISSAATQNAINSWARSITSNSWTEAQAATFAAQNEANVYVVPIVGLYEGLFGRTPDIGGLNAWVTAYRAGSTASLNTIAESFANSQEFAAIYGVAPTAATLVTALYANILGRVPDQTGYNAWVTYLGGAAAQPALTQIAATALAFGLSPESQQSTASEIQNWLIAGVGGIYPATIPGSIGNTNYSLVTGADNITATSNMTFHGVFGTLSGNIGDTLNALDRIIATGTGNELNIVDLGNGSSTGTVPAIVLNGIQTANIFAVGGERVNASAWSGLKTLNITASAGADAVTAANTTAVNITDTVPATPTPILVLGGAAVTLTVNGVAAPGTINVGTTMAPAGSVVVSESVLATQTGAFTADGMNLIGGTSVTVTVTLSAAVGANNVVAGGAITVTGNTATTSVTAGQTPATLAMTTAGGVVDGPVLISDGAFGKGGANTITTVSLSNYGGASSVNSDALTALSLSGVETAAGVSLTLNRAAIAASPSLNMTVNGFNGSVFDANNEVTTLNVTATGAKSTLNFNDTALAVLNVTGTQLLVLGGLGGASIGTIAIGGAAGFDDGGYLASMPGALTSFTTTSSGSIAATLNQNQGFTGSSGRDVITLSADAYKPIAGGSATNNEVILNAAATKFDATAAHLTAVNVTGFAILGLTANSTGTWDMSGLAPGFNAIDITAAAGFGNLGASIINAAAGTTLALNAASAAIISLGYADATGALDTTTLTIGSASAGGFATGGVSLADSRGTGIGTLNVVGKGADNAAPAGAYNQITTLTDNGLTRLNVSGGVGLIIQTLDEASTQATAFTINSTETGALGTTIGNLTDNSLGLLSFSGTNSSTISILSTTSTVLAVSNNGESSGTIGTLAAANLTNLTLGAGVALGPQSLALATTAAGLQDSSRAGVAVSGAMDNCPVTIGLVAGAALGNTDAIVLGNGNNSIVDASTSGAVIVTVGNGANRIDLHAGAGPTYLATVNLVAHSASVASDQILVGTVYAGATAANTTISGAVAGDSITFVDTAKWTVLMTTSQQAAISSLGSLPAAIAYVDSLPSTIAHSVSTFQYGGNTYLLESAATGTGKLTTNDGLVKLIGPTTYFPNYGGSVQTLTNGLSNYTGGPGNTIFLGTYTQAGTGTFNPGDNIAGNGSDSLIITPNAEAITPLDSYWKNISGINNVVFNTTGAGAQTINTGGFFNTAFSGAGVKLATTSAAGAITMNLTDFSGAATLSVTSDAGAQTINTSGNGPVTVIATSGAGAQIISSTNTAAVTVIATTTLGAQNIIIGDGNNIVTSVAGVSIVNVTVGTGTNTLSLGAATPTGNSLGAFNVFYGNHTATGHDSISVGTAGTAFATAANYVVTGATVGDIVSFAADPASAGSALVSLGPTTLAAIEAAVAGKGAHIVAYGVVAGNTYVAENMLAGATSATNTTLVELVGVHSLTAAIGHVTLAS